MPWSRDGRFAVPGPVFSRTSGGVNRLLKDGAHLVTEARDILDILWPGTAARLPVATDDPLPAKLSAEQLTVYRNLGAGATSHRRTGPEMLLDSYGAFGYFTAPRT
ncbi:MAG: hypothetical protein R2864_08710 [Syntrophotaleaceae bacterium]